jgi:MutS domain V
VAAPEVLIQYEGRLQQLQAGLTQVRTQHLAAAAILLIASAIFMTLGAYALKRRVPFWLPALPIPIATAAALHHRRLGVAGSRTRRLQRFYRRASQRVQGLWAGEGFTGDEFDDADHLYARDLGIFGQGSLFELLCIARTAIGRRGLAAYLLEAPPLDETRARQEAVRELRYRTELREEVALLGEFEFSESKWETFTEWLNSPPVPFSRPLSAALALTSALVLGIVLATAAGLLHWNRAVIWILPLVLFHSAAGFVFRDRVKRMMESIRSASVEIRVLREGLQLLEMQGFQSAKLSQITARAQNSSKSVRKLERLLGALHLRNKDWFYQAALLLMATTQLCMAVERWRKQYGAALRDWLQAWSEFEALNALANYAQENPDSAFPLFSNELSNESSNLNARFEAIALGHPLLPDETCVRNDVRLNYATRFYIVSGSNMSGKSSLLRAIGLNAVLAFAGAPVRAQALQLSPLSVCASMAVVDSLLNGKSKFLAEVDRVRQTIELAGSGRAVLFLIDEIFSGTNSRDRHVAAEAVVRTLLNRGAIGALSTHDMSLTAIADAKGLCGANVHMCAKDGSDPMNFDYRLKPGVTSESNALAIARMAGVPV